MKGPAVLSCPVLLNSVLRPAKFGAWLSCVLSYPNPVGGLDFRRRTQDMRGRGFSKLCTRNGGGSGRVECSNNFPPEGVRGADGGDTPAVGERHLISTAVAWRRCGCGSLVGTAFAEGVPVAVDSGIVDSVEELNNLIAGRSSFDLIPRAGRYELVYRNRWRMADREFPVLLEHHCRHGISITDPAESLFRGKGVKSADSAPPPRSGTEPGAESTPPPF